MNYLIDEASNTGKGGNTIISLLHHFLATHSLDETSVHFHADNCCGQNKNWFLMSYFMWRVLVGLHKEIKVSFLPVRHTKFHPTGVLDCLNSSTDQLTLAALMILFKLSVGQQLRILHNW